MNEEFPVSTLEARLISIRHSMSARDRRARRGQVPCDLRQNLQEDLWNLCESLRYLQNVELPNRRRPLILQQIEGLFTCMACKRSGVQVPYPPLRRRRNRAGERRNEHPSNP